MQDMVERALGKYVIIEEIGRGGMGAVYRARDMELDRIVALKVLSPYLVGEPHLVQRFMREARLAANLDHPNIVTIYDIGGEGSYYYFAMKFLDGMTLKEYLSKHKPLPLDRILDIVRQLASALDYAHDQNLIHRDVKPGNVMVANDGTVCLTDFGLAKVAENLKLTASGDTIGTLEYMAPEQARGNAEKASDIYSLGVIVYEMLAGRLPFQGNNQASLLYQHLHDPPPPLHQWNPQIPPDIEAAVLKAMAKDPAQRFLSAGAFFQAMQEAARRALPTAPVRQAPPPVPAAAPANAVVAAPTPRRIDWPALAREVARRIPPLPAIPGLPPLPPFVRRWGWPLAAGLVLVLLLGVGLPLLLGAPGGAPPPTATPSPRPTIPTALPTTSPPSPTLAPPTPTPLPEEPVTADLALLCGVDIDGQGGNLTSWKWGQHGPLLWPGLPNHPVVSLLSWAPSGSQIAIIIAEAGRPNLFTIFPTGAGLQRLTDSNDEKSDPAWSADGLQIAFADGPQGKREIYLIPATGGAIRNATSSKIDEWAPCWSNDSRYLAFGAKGEGLTNTEIVRLDLITGERLRLTNDPGEDIFPSWSPTAGEIAFLSNRSGEFLLYRMDSSGENVQLLVEQPVLLERPSWSPDGIWLAFSRQAPGEPPQIYFLNTATGKLVAGPADCRRPAWKPQP